ncbi:MAG TPA: cytochrome C, partial [Deltaproteobacteria bacterium]|nr:cytochrome C [Deltaproteobacteria bacterium]
DEAGALRCIACHGSTHAIYPARNPFDTYRDVIQPMQYQKNPYAIGANRSCFVCHTEEVEESVHHPNMFREVRVKGEF